MKHQILIIRKMKLDALTPTICVGKLIQNRIHIGLIFNDIEVEDAWFHFWNKGIEHFVGGNNGGVQATIIFC